MSKTLEKQHIPSPEEILLREQTLQTALGRLPGDKIPFPLHTEKRNRRKLEFGDVLLVQDEESDTHLGLLVVRGNGWNGRLAPLFYLKSGAVVPASTVDMHDPNNFLQIRVDKKQKNIRFIDQANHSMTFSPTKAEIIKPRNIEMKDAFRKYKLFDFCANHMMPLSILYAVPFGAVTLASAGVSLLSGGQSPISAREVVFNAEYMTLGAVMYRAGIYFRSRANESYQTFMAGYTNTFARGNKMVKELITQVMPA